MIEGLFVASQNLGEIYIVFEINQNIIIKFVIVFIVSHCICLISYYKGNRFF